jgi:type I restriction enzyme S subunit
LTDPKIDRQYQRSRLLEKDLLITIRGTTGRVALVPSELRGANITQDTARVRLQDDYSKDFFYFLLQSFPVQYQVSLHTLGQAVKGINIAELKKIHISLPPLEEQEMIAQKLNQITIYLRCVQEDLIKLKQQKTGLMQDLLTGKVRVTNLLKQKAATN